MKVLTHRHGVLLITLAAALWGSIGVVVALLSDGSMGIDPMLIAFGRVALAAPLLWVWHRTRARSWVIALTRMHLLLLCAAGGVFALYHVAYFAAIPRIGVTYAVLLNICTSPFFALLIARVHNAERIETSQVLGIGLAVAGCVLLVGGIPSSITLDLVGVGLALSAGLCYATLAVLTRRVAPAHDPVAIQAVIMTVAAGVIGIWMAVEQTPVQIAGIPWVALAYLALVPTVLSYVLYTRGLAVVHATTAASLTLFEPLVSTLLAVAVLGEALSLLSWCGALVLGMSLVWVGRKKG
ncbi:MAG: hypothetical protein RLY87_56 [Chloroflexota bacterium]